MKSLSELDIIRKRALNELNLHDKPDRIRIVVGMATCGIAAGDVYKRQKHGIPV